MSKVEQHIYLDSTILLTYLNLSDILFSCLYSFFGFYLLLISYRGLRFVDKGCSRLDLAEDSHALSTSLAAVQETRLACRSWPLYHVKHEQSSTWKGER